jgi:hypothetical protein
MKIARAFTIFAFLALPSLCIAAEMPIMLTGWTVDDIAGTAEGNSNYSTGNVNGWNFYQPGFNGSTNQGLPVNASRVLTANSGTQFQLAPYAGNNTSFVNQGSPQTLTLASPGSFSSLQFLDVDGNGFPTTWNVTLNFAGGTHTTISNFNDNDWTDANANNTDGSVAFTNYGLVAQNNANSYYNGYLYAAEHDYTLSATDATKILDSITLTNTNGGTVMFLALSGFEVPEPSSLAAICGLGFVGLIGLKWRRRGAARDTTRKTAADGMIASTKAVMLGVIVASLAMVGAISRASADTIALAPTSTTGGQVYDDLFGMDFNTNQPIRVTQLGVFDTGGDGVLNTDSPTQPVVVQLWDLNHPATPLATVNFGGGNPVGTDTAVGGGKVFFQSLATPLTLQAGGNYYIRIAD